MRKVEDIYQELTEDEKQAFDFCMDWGDRKGAGEILAEYEARREKKYGKGITNIIQHSDGPGNPGREKNSDKTPDQTEV